MVTREHILETLRRLLRERLHIHRHVGPETDIDRDLQLDSLQRLEVLVEIENGLSVSFDAADAKSIVTVGDLVDAIERRAAEQKHA